MKKMVTQRTVLTALALFGVAFLMLWMFKPVLAVDPTGADVSPGTPMTAPNDTADSELAFAGNVTYLDVTAFTTTQSWQGYFGNVSGTIQLADSSDNVLYNWSLLSPQGEVYASTNQTVQWRDIQCLNYSAAGGFSDESGNGGTVNVDGINLSTLESRFNINWDDVDGVNETFYLYDPTTGAGSGPGGHELFYTANLEFSLGECISTLVFDNSGAGASGNFQEVLMYEPVTGSVVFNSILDEEDVAGFDGNFYDFEMLVLEDGHGTDTVSTTYYFFVELE
jgi:hypothetical protein